MLESDYHLRSAILSRAHEAEIHHQDQQVMANDRPDTEQVKLQWWWLAMRRQAMRVM